MYKFFLEYIQHKCREEELGQQRLYYITEWYKYMLQQRAHSQHTTQLVGNVVAAAPDR